MFAPIVRVIREYIESAGRQKFFWSIVSIILISIILSIEPLFMARVIAYIEDFYQTGVFATREFFLFILFWAAYIVISMLIGYIHRYYIADLSALRFHNYIAKKYVENVYMMSLAAYLQKKTGSIYKNFDRGAGAHFQVIFFIMKDVIKTLTTLVVVLVLLIYTDYRMAFLALSMVPCMAVVAYYISQKTNEPQKENEIRWNRAFGHIGDFMSNIQLGKILLLEKDFIMRFSTELDIALTLQKGVSKYWAMSDMVTTVFVMISRFLVLGYGVYAIAHGDMLLAELILVFSLIGMIYYPLSFIFGSLGNLQKWSTELALFYTEFDMVEQESQDEGQSLDTIEGRIRFDDVSFGYVADRDILRNVSFAIERGEKIALVGHTGSGKSTLISLLFRFYDVTKGKMYIDDIDISTLSRKSLRTHIGMVAQDNSLFNLSIRENLLFARPDATESDIRAALEKASAEFVFSLTEGLDTIIGERGLKLSGGEKQRLSIARLFLQNPEILILDEATSALDNVTEKKIQKSLEILMEGKTTIIIAHRLSTIKHVDRICMIDDGQIVETGSYDELMSLGGRFAKLADPDRLVIS